jgi:hypothetical protein
VTRQPACSVLTAAAAAIIAPLLAAGERRESFDFDPGWDGLSNRQVPEPARRTRQDFGHRGSRHAGGKETGEVGG